MSLNLLTTSTRGQASTLKRYIINGASTNHTSFAVCEHDRMIYIVYEVTSPTDTYTFQTYNIQTGEMKILFNKTSSSMSVTGTLGSILCDGKYIYITFRNSDPGSFVKINCITGESTTYSSGVRYNCNGQSDWYDNNNIIISTSQGHMIFNINTNEFTHVTYKSDDSRFMFALGKKLICSTYTDLAYYDIENDINTTTPIPSVSSDSFVCYGNGKFYVVSSNRISIFDENTKTWDVDYFVMNIGNDIKDVKYTNGIIYIIPANSNKLWIYDTENNSGLYVMLPWTTTESLADVTRMVTFKGYAFFQYHTFAIINYEGTHKYNVGYKIRQYSLPFAESVCNYYEKTYALKLTDSCMILENAIEKKPLVPDESLEHVYTCHLNKNDYNAIVGISVDMYGGDDNG